MALVKTAFFCESLLFSLNIRLFARKIAIYLKKSRLHA
jgi:hypothetical protein